MTDRPLRILSNRRVLRWAFSLAYLACIIGANWALGRWGIVPIGFGFMAPAGVYFAGLSFGLRDAVQEDGGRLWVLTLILVGAFLSWWIDPTFAVASATAFLCSEVLDFAIYTPLRDREWVLAVAASNVAGSVLDSLLFLSIAFGSTAGWVDLTIGKTYMVIPGVAAVWWVRRTRVVGS